MGGRGGDEGGKMSASLTHVFAVMTEMRRSVHTNVHYQILLSQGCCTVARRRDRDLSGVSRQHFREVSSSGTTRGAALQLHRARSNTPKPIQQCSAEQTAHARGSAEHLPTRRTPGTTGAREASRGKHAHPRPTMMGSANTPSPIYFLGTCLRPMAVAPSLLRVDTKVKHLAR